MNEKQNEPILSKKYGHSRKLIFFFFFENDSWWFFEHRKMIANTVEESESYTKSIQKFANKFDFPQQIQKMNFSKSHSGIPNAFFFSSYDINLYTSGT